jgi:hypothetical protein
MKNSTHFSRLKAKTTSRWLFAVIFLLLFTSRGISQCLIHEEDDKPHHEVPTLTAEQMAVIKDHPVLNGEVGQKTTPTTLDVIISPNPAQNAIQLSYKTLELENATAISLSIIGVNGQIVYNQQYDNISDLPLRLSLEGMNAGIYSVVLKTTSSTTTKKLVIIK